MINNWHACFSRHVRLCGMGYQCDKQYNESIVCMCRAAHLHQVLPSLTGNSDKLRNVQFVMAFGNNISENG